MNINQFIKGRKPICVAPRYRHCRVQGLGVKKPYCLYCKLPL